MAYIVTVGLWLFCYVGLMAGTNDKREVFDTDLDIDVVNVISSMQTEIASLKSAVRSHEAEVAYLKSEARDKRLLLHDDLDVQQVITTLQGKVSTLESQVVTLQSNVPNAPSTSGSVYVRWGRTTCPGNGTEMIYHGRMAGSKWNVYSGGATPLCLPDDPTWASYVDGVNAARGRIYGTEIQAPDNIAHALFGKAVNDQDVPCAVCRTVRPSNVMLPVRANCYPGWTMEYSGYLVSSQEDWNTNVDYVCLDSGLEFAPHGAGNDNQNVIVVVEVMCGNAGSLPCPPFVDGREAACVVCSK